MPTFNNIIPPLRTTIALLTISVGVFVVNARNHNNDDSRLEAQRTKASYIFLEAGNAKNHNDFDAFYDLVQFAHGVDSTNTAINFYLGYFLFSMENSTRSKCEHAVQLMRPHFEAHPEDIHEAAFYYDANMMLGHNEEALRAIEEINRRTPYRYELLMRLGQAYSRNQQYYKAVAVYDTIEAQQGRSLPITTQKVENLLAANDTAAAFNQMYSLLATAPGNAGYNAAMAAMMQELGRTDSVMTYLDRAQQAEPDNGYTYLAKAEFYANQGDSVQYDNQIRLALTSDNLQLDDKLNVLTTFLRSATAAGINNQRVDNIFATLIEQHPHQERVHALYADYLVATKHYHDAAEQIGYILDLNPTDVDSWQRLLLVNILDQNYPAAIKAGDKAIELNPDNINLYNYVAPTYMQMGQYDKALELYNTLLQHTDSTDNKQISTTLAGMADVYFEKGDTLQAFNTYQRAIDLYPDNVGTMNNYAYNLALAGTDLDKAERLAATAVQAAPNNATYLDTYAWVFFRQGNYTMALMYIRSAIENDTEGDSADIFDHYGDILFFNGQTEQAVEQWRKAAELDPDNELLQRKVQQQTYLEK